MAPAVLVSIVLVRWGNFMNGELFGDPTRLPWGVAVPGLPGGPRHPLPLYEIAGTLAILVGILAPSGVARRRPFDGAVWWSAIIASSVLRFLLDLLRTQDRTPLFLTLGQMAALALIAWGAWFLWTGRRRTRSPSAARPPQATSLPAAPASPPRGTFGRRNAAASPASARGSTRIAR
jgi:phosphatidylglycerol:prolipoprotein diacylglycerol transferase